MQMINKTEVVDLPISFDNLGLEDEIDVVDGVDYIEDGLVYSLKNLGRVDIDYISKITSLDKDEVIRSLDGAIYQDPSDWNGNPYLGYKTADEYLSGNLIKKLYVAEAANKTYKGRFDKNIEAIKSVLPSGISCSEIYFNLASPWMPKNIIIDFAEVCIKSKDKPVYEEVTGLWLVDGVRSYSNMDYEYSAHGLSGIGILEKILNNKSLNVYDYYKDYDGKSKKLFNKEATLLIEQKANLMQQRFKDFILNNENYKKLVEDAYNEKYGYNVARTYDGSFLSFPFMNKDLVLFLHQKNAIARIIFNHNTLLAHEVGSGKSYTMIAAAEEMYRMGLSKKNLFVVPNNIVKQWENFYRYAYPNANILVLYAKDFAPLNKKATLDKIKNCTYSSIIMPYSSFDNLAYKNSDTLNKLKAKYQEVVDKKKKEPWFSSERAALDKYQKKLHKQIIDMEISGIDIDKNYAFEELGITRLFLDEAHNYKNLAFENRMENIRGISSDGSTKCTHLKHICDYLNSKPDGGIIMATGTPITNSITDIYAFQRYLQDGELKLLDIKDFGSWISMFAELNTEYEVDLDTKAYRAVTRLSKFHNLPELAQILSNIADFHFNPANPELPKFNGYTDTMLNISYDLKCFLGGISKRVELVRKSLVSREEDNMLKITTDGRKAALDLRLIDPIIYKDSTNNKIGRCATNIANIYLKTKDFKGTQLVFCDTSIPKSGFNVYDELKNVLVSKYNIPDNEIAYVHDATTEKSRDNLFKKMQKGEIRILIGSTFKLGTGVNVQNKLYAIHHLDIPWRPADMVQREGRILRQGNLNKEVFIYRYIAEGSFDAYSWQLLEIKQKFISELLSNSINERNKEDIQDTVLNYAEVKALAIGNPKLKEHIECKNELNKYKILAKKTNDEVARKKRRLAEIPKVKEALDKKISELSEDIILYEVSKKEYEKNERDKLKMSLWFSLMDYINKDKEKVLFKYQGFDVVLPDKLIANSLYIELRGSGKYIIPIGNSDRGALVRVDNFLNKLNEYKEENILKRNDLDLEEILIKEALKNQIDYSDKISELSTKLKELGEELGINE